MIIRSLFGSGGVFTLYLLHPGYNMAFWNRESYVGDLPVNLYGKLEAVE